MAIKYRCSECGAIGVADDSEAGELVCCGKCRAVNLLPARSAPPQPPTGHPTSANSAIRSPHVGPGVLFLVGVALTIIGWGIGGNVGGPILLIGVLGIVACFAWIVRVGDSKYARLHPEIQPPAPQEPRELSERELLESIDKRLKAIEANSDTTRTYAGCLLAVAILFTALAIGGCLVIENQQSAIRFSHLSR